MKTKVKALAAALPLLAAVQANAAISVDNISRVGSGSGSGTLFLSVIDRGGSSPESYVRDLGALGTTGSILSATNPFSSFSAAPIAADTNLQSLLSHSQSDGGSIYWQVTAINNQPSTGIGAMVTSATPLNSGNIPQGGPGFNTPFIHINSYASSVNQALGANSSVVIPQSNSGAFYDGNNFGGSWLNPVTSEAAIGQSMGFYFAQPISSTASQATAFSDQWTLAANGTLTYGSVAPVPLPPAVWLLGSALVGLVGVGRRRGTAAV